MDAYHNHSPPADLTATSFLSRLADLKTHWTLPINGESKNDSITHKSNNLGFKEN
ncbi:hypothetical protein [Bacillus sp. OV322]|uniref:hypothetical protein n=1 Tax=Bacillus sp. OV322 TaxID=1882764 RepID=UPI0015A70EC8|nr:hypothetical protein [Bacillus sp. OV322]